MVHQRDEPPRWPQGREERNLVDVLDDTVEGVGGQVSRIVSAGEEWIGVARADAVHFDTFERRAGGSAWPRAAEQRNLMTARGNPAEDLPEMKLGSTSMRIFVVLPVQHEYPH